MVEVLLCGGGCTAVHTATHSSHTCGLPFHIRYTTSKAQLLLHGYHTYPLLTVCLVTLVLLSPQTALRVPLTVVVGLVGFDGIRGERHFRLETPVCVYTVLALGQSRNSLYTWS